jgi:hypothetical protein
VEGRRPSSDGGESFTYYDVDEEALSADAYVSRLAPRRGDGGPPARDWSEPPSPAPAPTPTPTPAPAAAPARWPEQASPFSTSTARSEPVPPPGEPEPRVRSIFDGPAPSNRDAQPAAGPALPGTPLADAPLPDAMPPRAAPAADSTPREAWIPTSPLGAAPSATSPVGPELAASSAAAAAATVAPAPASPGPGRAPELTAAGLMRRSPKQQIRDLTADVAAAGTERPATAQRSPEEVRRMLSRYRTGLQRGRSGGVELSEGGPDGRGGRDNRGQNEPSGYDPGAEDRR